MVSYLLVDDKTGKVLAELAGAREVVRLLRGIGRNPHGSPAVSLVRVDHQEGNLTDITSMVSVRTLPPLVTRRAKITRSQVRPSRPAPPTQPPAPD